MVAILDLIGHFLILGAGLLYLSSIILYLIKTKDYKVLFMSIFIADFSKMDKKVKKILVFSFISFVSAIVIFSYTNNNENIREVKESPLSGPINKFLYDKK